MPRTTQTRSPGDSSPDALDVLTRAILREIAGWLETRPWNRPGTDKSWVLAAMSESLAFHTRVRQAERVRNR